MYGSHHLENKNTIGVEGTLKLCFNEDRVVHLTSSPSRDQQCQSEKLSKYNFSTHKHGPVVSRNTSPKQYCHFQNVQAFACVDPALLQSRIRSKQCGRTHSNSKSHHESNFYAIKTAWLRCSLHDDLQALFYCTVSTSLISVFF